MKAGSSEANHRPQRPEWYKRIKKYETPSRPRAVWQILNTLVPYLLLWYLMIRGISAGFPYWAILLISVPAGLLLVRIFIIFHDCTHRSFFRSPWANTVTGYISGILTFTPYDSWRHHHSIHHNTASDLDRRGTGDIRTLTIAEYENASWKKRLIYRLYRNPFVMFALGPLLIFLMAQRLPGKNADRRDRISVYITDAAIAVIITAASLSIGFRTYFLIQFPVILIGGAVGVWLFFVQHQFEGVYWARHDQWDRMHAAIEGASFYHLPKVLQWISGNIGLHHIHHTRARIPNYNLQRCYDEVSELRANRPLRFFESLRCVGLKLWDEKQGKLVGYRSVE